MGTPLVSIVMAAYNAEKYLNRAVDSILKQTYTNLQLVIVNDGSTDSTKEIVMRYNDPRIKYVENESNSGLVFTRNKGINESTGKYIAVLDSDDIAVTDKIERQVNFLEQNEDYGFCATYYTTIDVDDNQTSNVTMPLSDEDIKTYLCIDNCICNSTIMVKADLIKNAGYAQGADYIEDTELLQRLAKITRIRTLPFFGTLYRVHANNISTVKKVKMFALIKELNRIKLNDMGISFSERELDMHSALIVYDNSLFKGRQELVELENWILNLDDKLKNKKQYNIKIMYKVLVEKWLVACLKSKQYAMIGFNKLFFRHPAIYIQVLRCKIFGKPVRF
jgi:glycosyltransferase involved in cell wall biosynthesis